MIHFTLAACFLAARIGAVPRHAGGEHFEGRIAFRAGALSAEALCKAK